MSEIKVKVKGDGVGWWVITEGGATDQKLGPHGDYLDAIGQANALRKRIAEAMRAREEKA